MRTVITLALLATLALSACAPAADSAGAQATIVAMSVQLTVAAEETEQVVTELPSPTPAQIEPTATPQPAATEPSAPEEPPTEEPSAPEAPAPTAYVVPDWPLLRRGNQGDLVYALQHLLKVYGAILTVDGKFGPQTKAEVSTFQNSQGLTPDGIVGPLTWAALVKGNQVKQNSHGQAVRALQYLLNHRHGYANVNVDGDFGPITDARVREFQEAYDLKVDGIVGPQTWQALIAIEP